jgi:spermidine/putrescine ABC transporter ATP-binding subunit
MRAVVELKHVDQRFGTVEAVSGLSLAVRRGEMLAVLGPSGSGKTTVLRMLAGLERPSSGEIWIDGRSMNDVPAHQRNLGLVPQNYALFPHMNVFDNVAFGLRMRRVGTTALRPRVARALALVRLEAFGRRLPHQLSGGQQQRVALARAIVVEPVVLLLDEPLGALDRKLREEMQVELKQLQHELQVTTLFVTHDQEEALSLSDRIAVMNHGRLHQLDAPQVLYDLPATRFVAGFLGAPNFIAGKIVSRESGVLEIQTDAGLRLLAANGPAEPHPQRVEASVRPEKIVVTTEEPTLPNRVRGSVESCVFLGGTIRYHVRAAGGLRLLACAQNFLPLAVSPGEDVWLSWHPSDTRLFGVDEGDA